MESLEISMDSVINKNFWGGKKVFVTGHTGFKGSWICLWLQSLGANVTGFSLEPNAEPNLFTEADVSQGMVSIIGDICDFEAISEAMKTQQPEIVIHMAAQPLVRLSYNKPVKTYETNVMGTVHLLESVRQLTSVKAVINVTTDKCYENKEWPWGYRENEPMGGYDPYSNSKGCSELVTSAYRSSFFNNLNIAVASARAGNVIGGGDWAFDRLIPDMLLSFQNSNPIKVRSPQAIRPWQHVLEPLSGYLILAEKLFLNGPEFAEAWNFGPVDDDAKCVEWIAERMSTLWGDGARWTLDCDVHVHEANLLKLDISKAKSKLGWFPKTTLDDTLESIISWHKSWLNQVPARRLCLNEIQKFQNLSED